METASQEQQNTAEAASTVEETLNNATNVVDQSAIEKELEAAKAKAAENLAGWQRERADFANYKKRQEQQISDLRAFATTDLIKRLLPIADDFDRAARNVPDELKGNGWLDGVMLVHRKLQQALDAEGVKSITATKGDVFDPNVHEAVTHDDADDVESGHVIEELQKGYKIGERVIRPSLVRVAR